MDEAAESDEEEGSGKDTVEDEASAGADPSGGFTSSSRSAPPEEELLVISSSGDEDPSRGAPSRHTAEEAEGRRAKGGCCDPRTKLAHDRDAGAVRGAPRKEAGAPRGGTNANSPSRRRRRRGCGGWPMSKP